jgi:hypothetical protein
LGREVFERITAEYDGHGFIHKVSRVSRNGRPRRCSGLS